MSKERKKKGSPANNFAGQRIDDNSSTSSNRGNKDDNSSTSKGKKAEIQKPDSDKITLLDDGKISSRAKSSKKRKESREVDNSTTSENRGVDNSTPSKDNSCERLDKSKDNSNDISSPSDNNQDDGGRINSSGGGYEIPIIAEANREILAASLARGNEDNSDKEGYNSDNSDDTNSTSGTQFNHFSDDESEDPFKDDELGDHQSWRCETSSNNRLNNPWGWIEAMCARL